MTKIAFLPHRAVIRLSGPDWAKFLKGLCTAHIETLGAEVQQGRFARLHYGAFLRPQGKVIADVLLHAVAPDDIRLDVPLSVRDELLAKLNMYKMRAQVTIEALDTPVFVAFDGVPEDFMADPRGPIVGGSFAMSYNAQRADTDIGEWINFRISLGISDPGYDFDADELYAIDANLDLLDAVDFHKGCYVGQELTSRMKRRGQIKNRILPFRYENEAPEMGSEILNDDRRAGEVLLASQGLGLALMRLDRLVGNLSFENAPLDLAVPPWLAPYAVPTPNPQGV